MKREVISSNMEHYLKAIAFLKKEQGMARVSEIGRLMNVKKPSVSAALAVLASKKLVIHEKYGGVELTARGERIATEVQRRRDVLVRFLTEILAVDSRAAAQDACQMEHILSTETFERLTGFLEFAETSCRQENPRCMGNFGKSARAKAAEPEYNL